MYRPRRLTLLSSLAFVGLATLPSTGAFAAVSLNFTDNDATPTAASVSSGSSFTVTLNLTSTAEQTTGLDYFLRDNTFVSGTPRFRITDRNIGASTYSDPFNGDAAVEAQPASLLNPSTDLDLGATLANPSSPNGAGTFLVANYTFAVDPTTPLGTYTISTFSQPGTGYQAGPPLFTDMPFNQHATFNVTVVPEPSAVALLGLGAIGLLRRRRIDRV